MAYDLAQTERVAKDVNECLAKMRLDLVGLDRTIQLFDPTIDPPAIEPIQAHKRSVQRGAP